MFVNKLTAYHIFKDESISGFLRQATQISIDLVYRHLNDQSNALSVAKSKIFQYIDAFVRLIALIVKYSGENNPNTKINILNKVSYLN